MLTRQCRAEHVGTWDHFSYSSPMSASGCAGLDARAAAIVMRTVRNIVSPLLELLKHGLSRQSACVLLQSCQSVCQDSLSVMSECHV